MKTKAKKYPALCDPELEEIAGDLDASQRRDMARKLELWTAQLDYSAAFIEESAGRGETLTDEDGDPKLVELAARLEHQAVQIRSYLGMSAKPKPTVARMHFLAAN
jgi:hypothetical protein